MKRFAVLLLTMTLAVLATGAEEPAPEPAPPRRLQVRYRRKKVFERREEETRGGLKRAFYFPRMRVDGAVKNDSDDHLEEVTVVLRIVEYKIGKVRRPGSRSGKLIVEQTTVVRNIQPGEAKTFRFQFRLHGDGRPRERYGNHYDGAWCGKLKPNERLKISLKGARWADEEDGE